MFSCFRKKTITEERIIGINGVHFIVIQNYVPTRKNIMLTSAQFKSIMNNLNIEKEDVMKVQELYEKYKRDLKDITITIDGYY